MKSLKFNSLLLILVLFSCKSIKKDKQQVITEDIKIERTLDTSVKDQNLKLDIKEKASEVITEETINTHEIFTVNGEEVLKPVVKTTKITEKDGEKVSSETKSEVIQNNISTQRDSISKKDSLNLKKESEGIEVIKEIVGGLADGVLGLTGKILIGGILLVILIRLIRKKPKEDIKNNTNLTNNK